jgi:hypothetical protein
MDYSQGDKSTYQRLFAVKVGALQLGTSHKSIEYLDLDPQGAYERVSLRTLELALTKEPNNKKGLESALTKGPKVHSNKEFT